MHNPVRTSIIHMRAIPLYKWVRDQRECRVANNHQRSVTFLPLPFQWGLGVLGSGHKSIQESALYASSHHNTWYMVSLSNGSRSLFTYPYLFLKCVGDRMIGMQNHKFLGIRERERKLFPSLREMETHKSSIPHFWCPFVQMGSVYVIYKCEEIPSCTKFEY